MEGNPTPEQAARHQELADIFREGWERFRREDPVRANVMTWVVEDGLSIEDISQLLGRSRGATREFVTQCRKRARLYLADWYAQSAGDGCVSTEDDQAWLDALAGRRGPDAGPDAQEARRCGR